MNFSSLRILSVVLALVFLGFSRSEAQVTNLLTSFSDNFNRTNGAIGTNYTLGAGSPYVITNNQLLRTGTDEALTFLNVGALPTAAQFDGGSSYSSSIDLFFDNQTNSRLFGLLLNYSNSANYGAVAIRGDGNNQLQWRSRFGGTGGSQGIFSSISYTTNTWYTVTVSAIEAGLYNIALAVRGSTNVLRSGVFQDTNVLSGGTIGFYGDTGSPGTNNFFDNLSVAVEQSPVFTTGIEPESVG